MWTFCKVSYWYMNVENKNDNNLDIQLYSISNKKYIKRNVLGFWCFFKTMSLKMKTKQKFGWNIAPEHYNLGYQITSCAVSIRVQSVSFFRLLYWDTYLEHWVNIDRVTCNVTCLQKSHRAWTSCRHDLYTAQWKNTTNLMFYGDRTVWFSSAFDMKKGGTSQKLYSCCFCKFGIYVKIMTQNINFPIEPV